MAFENYVHSAVINGSASSNKLRLGYGYTPVKMYIPASFSGTSVTFEMAEKADGTWAALKDSADAAVTITVTADNWYELAPNTFAGVEHLQIVSSATETSKTILLVASKLQGN